MGASMKVSERELSIDFVGCQVDEIDRRAGGRCDGMKFVDFVVSTPENDSLLVELTDPSDTTAPAVGREEFRRKLGKGDLVMECVQKARGTYCYLHLMNRSNDDKCFVLLIGDDHPDLKLDRAIFSTLQDKIVHRSRHEGLEPWKLPYLNGVVVLGISDWKKYYPKFSLERIAAAPGLEPKHA
jgi:hypothetical protein